MSEQVKSKFLGNLTLKAMERADHDLTQLVELHRVRMSSDLLGDDAILRTRQVAEVVGVQPRTLEKWRRDGEGPQWRMAVGQNWRWSKFNKINKNIELMLI